MGLNEKMTKQGVRDLNHAFPKKRPTVLEAEGSPVEAALLVAPAAVVAEGAVTSSIEP